MSLANIYDARTGTYERGGASSHDPGGASVYHVDKYSNALSFKDNANNRAVEYPLGTRENPHIIGQNAEALENYLAPTYENDYSPIADAFLQSFGGMNDVYSDMIDAQYALSERNSALSQEMADKANAFNAEQAKISRAWSAEQVKQQREWQTEMSNTAHQREVSDLIASGLNPILSANNGASTPSGGIPSASTATGHMGQVDTSAVNAGSNLLSAALSAAVQMQSINAQKEMQRYNIDNQLYMQTQQIEAELARTELAGKYGVKQAEEQKLGSFAIAGASKYGHELSYQLGMDEHQTRKDITAMQYGYDKELQSDKYGYELDMLKQRFANDLAIKGYDFRTALAIADRYIRSNEDIARMYIEGHKDVTNIQGGYSVFDTLVRTAGQVGAAGVISGLVGYRPNKNPIGFRP